MNKKILLFLLLVSGLGLSGFGTHKFYVAILQVNHAPEKKMLQITSRVFIDDLNDALAIKNKVKGRFGERDQSARDEEMMRDYFASHLQIIVNGKPSAPEFKGLELENNVLICYFVIPNVSRVKSLEIRDKILTDLVTEQQNIIQTHVNGKKSSHLLTFENDRVKLAY